MKKQHQYLLSLLPLGIVLTGLIDLVAATVTTAAQPLGVLPFQGWLALDTKYDYAETAESRQEELDLYQANATVETWVVRDGINWPSVTILRAPSYRLGLLEDCLFFEVAVGDSGLGGFTQLVTWCEPLASQQWQHVAGVFDGDHDEMRLYVDGNLVATQALAPDTTILVNAGSNQVGGRGISALDEVRISDQVRYTNSFALSQLPFDCDEHTRALWHFDEAAGARVFNDVCGYNNILLGTAGAYTAGNYPVYLPITKVAQ